MPVLSFRNINRIRIRGKWHKEIESLHEILEYLASGGPQPDSSWAESPKRLISELISGTPPASGQRDDILRSLINEHAERSPSTKDVAVLSCLSSFQHNVAVEHLAGLKNLEVERYLRCVLIAKQLHTYLVSESESRILLSLLSVLDNPQNDLASFAQLIEPVAARTESTFLDVEIVRRALTRFGILPRLELTVLGLIEKRHLASLHDVLSRLRSLNAASYSSEVLRLLDDYLPSWAYLEIWRPVYYRIYRWEHGNFTNEQRRRLMGIFELDGPDTATRTQASLRLSDPASFERVDIRPRQTTTLERLLEVLYRAEKVGQQAVDLFIHLCIDSRPDEAAITLLENCISTGDDSCCPAIRSLIKASSNSLSLDRQMKSITNALTALSESVVHTDLARSVGDTTRITIDIWNRAQARFLQQLSTRQSSTGLTGEYIGMRMHELGTTVLNTPWLHEHLPSKMLNQITNLPPRDILEAVFRHMKDMSGSVDFRFKSFLEFSLGGREVQAGGHMTLDAIQDEVHFWKRPPDTTQRDLARTLGKISSLEYSWYTKCLTQMVREKDLYIEEMRHIIQPEGTQTCENFAKYLRRRRGLYQLQNECWLLLLVALIDDHARCRDGEYFKMIAGSMTYKQWATYTADLNHLFAPIRSQLREFGYGLTRSLLDWWDKLAQSPGVKFLLERQKGPKQFTWIYFQDSSSRMSYFEYLLNVLSDESRMTPLIRKIVARLDDGGSSWVDVILCIQSVEGWSPSDFSAKLCEMFIARQMEQWPDEGLKVLAKSWFPTIPENFTDLFFSEPFSNRPNPVAIRSTGDRLLASYNTLIGRGRNLEALRIRLRRQDPTRIAALLNRIGVENPAGARATNEDIDETLIDAVETISDCEFETSFPLTSLSDLQRRAKGIPTSSRILVIRLHLQDNSNPAFCLHFSPQDDELTRHRYWNATGAGPTEHICNATLNLFTYYIARNLHRLLNGRTSRERTLLQSIHTTVQDLVNKSPQTCIVCLQPMAIKLWKPAACSRQCSFSLVRGSPLEVRLHNLLVDPLAIDLLLTSIYAAATDTASFELLPGCPIARNRLTAVIDSMPPLPTLQVANNLRSAIRGTDQYGADRERLLSWLCLKFRGFMVSAPEGYRVPNMGHARQFVLVNSHHEREAAYQSVIGAHLNSGVAFHGTSASRLFCILANGLQVMHGNAVLNGAAYGPGIYLGDDQATSIGFARSTGQSWRHSALGNMSVMLGCELAAYARASHHPIHVIADEKRVLVRYVFLLPQGYRCPPRHHVEPAMLQAFALLRSGVI